MAATNPGPKVSRLEEDEEDMDDCDSMNVLASSNKKYHRKASPPPTRARRDRPKPLSPKQVLLSSDEEEAPMSVTESLQVQAAGRSDGSTVEGQDASSAINVEDYLAATQETAVDDIDPFVGMGGLIKNKSVASVSDDEQPPATSNPFDDEEADSVATEEDEMHIETTLQEEKGVIEISPRSKSMSESDEEPEEEEEEEEEDIVESSKRLLRMCDERMQYQTHNEEIKGLKDTIEQQKNQAEAMAEQLRRAVETKCDLVLAQNEMERRHEQDVIAKDAEIKNMRAYIQEILEAQAKSELNFMNEISSLAGKLERMETKRKKENEEKDLEIERLEGKVKDLKTGSVRSNSSRQAFRGRFTGSTGSVGSHSTSKKSLSTRSRQKVTPVM